MKKLDLALIFQLSISTTDMDKSLNGWRSCFNINEDSIIRKSTKEIYDRGEYHCKNFLEQEVEFYHKYYRFDLGGLDMEMIEPITTDNVNPYTSFLKYGKNGLQHLGIKINNRPDLVENMKEIGVPVYTYSYMGPVEPDITKRADCYFYDLRPQLGIVIEAGGAVVGPLATDPRAGGQEALGLLNSFAVKPVLPEYEPIPGINKMTIKDIYQIAVVVEDAEAVLKNWQEWFGLENEPVSRGEEAGGRFARISAGGVDVKIIEPSGDGLYKEFYEKSGGNNIMYVGAVMEDYDAALKTMEELGEKPLLCLEGNDGDPSDKGAVLYDLRDRVGLILKVSRVMAGPHAEE